MINWGVASIYKTRYPVSHNIQKHIDAELNKIIRDDIIEPSNSAWSSPLILVPKKMKLIDL